MRGEGSPQAGRIVQRRRLALLAFLASFRDRPLSRDKLIACLWPESGASQARHSLSDSLHVIRKALGEDAVLVEGDELRLNPEAVSCDVWEFESALEAGDLERAVGFYAGPFLDGFFVGGNALEFEGWAASERERLARAYLGAIERLAESAARAGEPRQAAEWWRRLCDEDPENSRAVLGLMEALAATGDRAGALREAETHAEHLRSEYGAEPDPTVTALVRQLQEEPEVWVPVAAASGSGSAARGAKLNQGSLDPVTGDPEEADGALPGGFQRTFAPRQTLLGGAAAAILVLLTAFYVARWVPESEHLTPEEVLAANAAPGIAVLPFTVNDPALESWREGMVDLLSVNLDGVPELRAINSRTVLARWGEAVPDTARADLPTALAVARRTGARYALVGSVVTVGADLQLSAEVYEVRGGRKLGDAQVVGAPDSTLRLVNRLTVGVLKALPREAGVLAAVDLAEVTTDSLAALKAYLKGEALYRRADFQGAAGAFERAVASDSLFALAWARLGDTCFWRSGSKLCERGPPWERDEYLRRLPARRAELERALSVVFQGAVEGIQARWQLVREYPDDPDAWYWLGEGYWHFGALALMDPAEGIPALERAIALAPTTSAEPYIHLIEHAFAEMDSARIGRLVDAYEQITRGAGRRYREYRLAFDLGFGDAATRARTHAALDTVPTAILASALLNLINPRLFGVTEEGLQALLVRPDLHAGPRSAILNSRGRLREALDATNDPIFSPQSRAALYFLLYQVGIHLPSEELEQVLAAGAADTTPGSLSESTFLWVGAYAVDRGDWEKYALALERQRARARRFTAQGDSPVMPGQAPNFFTARSHEGAARALEGYALWKRGRTAEAIRALEAGQRQVFGATDEFAEVTVRWWLAELMLEVGRPRDAERYFKSLYAIWPGPVNRDPFVALRLGKVYEELGEYEKARESYEYALLSWQDADPEIEPRIQEARAGLARLPKPLRREGP